MTDPLDYTDYGARLAIGFAIMNGLEHTIDFSEDSNEDELNEEYDFED